MTQASPDSTSRDGAMTRLFWPGTRWFWPSVIVCLIVQAVLAADCARTWTPTHDEFWHLPIGLRMWTSGQFDDDVINPPLVRLWAAIPLALGGAQPGDAGPKPDVGEIGDAFWAANSDVRFWFLCGRLMIVPLATLTGLILAAWGRAWYGERAAFLSVLLFCCCPTVIANAAIVTHDLPLAAAWLTALFTLVRFAERPTWRTALVFGAALGIAQQTKLTALALGPLSVVVWFILRWRSANPSGSESMASVGPEVQKEKEEAETCGRAFRRGQETRAEQVETRAELARYWFAAILVALFVVNASYLFRGTGTALKDVPFASGRMIAMQRAFGVVGWSPVPLPRDYIAAFDRLAQDLERKHPVYLDGEWRDRPFARYYAAALSYKLPLATLALFLIACVVVVWPQSNGHLGPLHRRRALCVLIAAAVLPVLASGSANQIGIRYILPTLPLLHLFAGQAVGVLSDSKRRVLRLIVWTALLTAPLALRFHPHHLAYFNALVGGPARGGWHLVDSNIDWGQDLHALKEFLDERQVTEIGLAYFGTVVPARIGIAARPLPSRFPQPGWYAVSVNFVHGRPHAIRDQNGDRTQVGIGEFGYFRFFEPVARIGYSIDVYHLTDRDVARYGHALRQLNSSAGGP